MTHKRIVLTVLTVVSMSLPGASFAQTSERTRKPARDTAARRVSRSRAVSADLLFIILELLTVGHSKPYENNTSSIKVAYLSVHEPSLLSPCLCTLWPL